MHEKEQSGLNFIIHVKSGDPHVDIYIYAMQCNDTLSWMLRVFVMRTRIKKIHEHDIFSPFFFVCVCVCAEYVPINVQYSNIFSWWIVCNIVCAVISSHFSPSPLFIFFFLAFYRSEYVWFFEHAQGRKAMCF